MKGRGCRLKVEARQRHARLPPRKQSSATGRTTPSDVVQSGHEMTREAGYRSPRQSGIAPLSLANCTTD